MSSFEGLQFYGLTFLRFEKYEGGQFNRLFGISYRIRNWQWSFSNPQLMNCTEISYVRSWFMHTILIGAVYPCICFLCLKYSSSSITLIVTQWIIGELWFADIQPSWILMIYSRKQILVIRTDGFGNIQFNLNLCSSFLISSPWMLFLNLPIVRDIADNSSNSLLLQSPTGRLLLRLLLCHNI